VPPVPGQPDAAPGVRAGLQPGQLRGQLALPRSVQTWTLTTLREKLIKIGAKVVRHARAVTFQLADVAVPRALFAAILARIGRLRAAPASGDRSSRADENGVESRRMEIVFHEVKETRRGASRTGPLGRLLKPVACRPLQFHRFLWTWECAGSPMCVQERRARTRTMRSTLSWEIPALDPDGPSPIPTIGGHHLGAASISGAPPTTNAGESTHALRRF
jgi:hypothetical protein